MARPQQFRAPSSIIQWARMDLDEGFAFLAQPYNDRRIRDRPIASPSGIDVFQREYAKLGRAGLRCTCGRQATHFAAVRHSNDHEGAFVMNLFADSVLFTRDHIVPKSLNGSNHVDNMRVMCAPCNGKRGNRIGLLDLLHGALFIHAVQNVPSVKSPLTTLIQDALAFDLPPTA